MQHIITIKGTDLLDALWSGQLVYDGEIDGIDEDDRIEKVQLRYGDEIIITIGEDERSLR